MPKIEVSKLLKQGKDKVYSVLKNIEEFPNFMKGVKKLEVLERSNDRLVTHWEVEVDGANIIWKEEDIFDDKQRLMKFRMLEGDYKSYEGTWKIENSPQGTKITISANFDWGIPNFERFVGPVLVRKARTSFKGMLNALGKELEMRKI